MALDRNKGVGSAFSILKDGSVVGFQPTETCGYQNGCSRNAIGRDKLIDVTTSGQIGIRLDDNRILDIDPNGSPHGATMEIVERGGKNSCQAWKVAHQMDLNHGLKKDPNNCPVIGGSYNTCPMLYGPPEQVADAARHGYHMEVGPASPMTYDGPAANLANGLNGLPGSTIRPEETQDFLAALLENLLSKNGGTATA